MRTFDLTSLVAESERGDQRWREFLRLPSLSMGLYRLRAGQPRSSSRTPRTRCQALPTTR
jgi:hypothetical protein